MKKLFCLLPLALFCHTALAAIESITILDGDFHTINTLIQPKEVKAFTGLWHTRVVSDIKTKVDWSKGFKLDISGSDDSGRWLYHNGWLMRLAKSTSVGRYKIPNHQQFELVLGITHDKLCLSQPEKMQAE